MWVQSLDQEDLLEEGMANPLQYSCLDNPLDIGVWWATVQRDAKSWTLLKGLSMHARKHTFQDNHHPPGLKLLCKQQGLTLS